MSATARFGLGAACSAALVTARPIPSANQSKVPGRV